jgi:hypothetical protein
MKSVTGHLLDYENEKETGDWARMFGPGAVGKGVLEITAKGSGYANQAQFKRLKSKSQVNVVNKSLYINKIKARKRLIPQTCLF